MNQNNPTASSLAVLPVLKYGNPLLRKKVRPIHDFAIIPEMLETMFKSMEAENGIGLAANQVGFNYNLLIIDTRNYNDGEEGETHIFVNAEILHSEGEAIIEEGCLSIPNIHAEIKRPEAIVLKYQDVEQNIYERYFSGFISRTIQHEVDHLNGKLFIDYLPQAKRILINKHLLEISKTGKLSSGIIL